MSTEAFRVSGQHRYPTVLSLPEAARQLSVSEDAIRAWIKKGLLPAVKVGPGGRYRIAQVDLDRLVEREP